MFTLNWSKINFKVLQILSNFGLANLRWKRAMKFNTRYFCVICTSKGNFALPRALWVYFYDIMVHTPCHLAPRTPSPQIPFLLVTAPLGLNQKRLFKICVKTLLVPFQAIDIKFATQRLPIMLLPQ